MYQVVAMVPDQGTAALIGGFLQVSGITVRELQISPHASFAGGDTSYYIEVLESERDQAAGLLIEEGYGKWVPS